MSYGQLEPEFHEAYSGWKTNPGPESNMAMLGLLQKDIEGAARLHANDSNPLLLSRARRMALDGLRTYDPNKGKLRTHVYNNLQGLKRVQAQQSQVLSVPQRVRQEKYQLDQAEQSLSHDLGREPTDAELMDYTGLAPRRLARLRSFHPAVAEGTLSRNDPNYSTGGVDPLRKSRAELITNLVYDDLDPYHQKIMELTLGLHGRSPLANQDIARRLNRSPGAISQAKAKIQRLLDDTASVAGLL